MLHRKEICYLLSDCYHGGTAYSLFYHVSCDISQNYQHFFEKESRILKKIFHGTRIWDLNFERPSRI